MAHNARPAASYRGARRNAARAKIKDTDATLREVWPYFIRRPIAAKGSRRKGKG